MIAIIVSFVMIGQTDAFEIGVKMRADSNRMLMGIHGISYEVADILNGSNLTVAQAKHIFAQRQAEEAAQNAILLRSAKRNIAQSSAVIVKVWDKQNQTYQKLIETKEIPEAVASQMRGLIRADIENTSQILNRAATDKSVPKNLRTAARAHMNKAKAALDRLERAETK